MAQRFEDFAKSIIALTAWSYASHYGSQVPQLMVAQVIANRARRGWGSILDVVDRMPRYEAAPPTTEGLPDSWDKAFLRVLAEIDPIYDGTSKDTTNGGLYFGDLNDIQNPSFLEKIARNPEHHRVADCAGTLVFWD